jgi:hypothetical protein
MRILVVHDSFGEVRSYAILSERSGYIGEHLRPNRIGMVTRHGEHFSELELPTSALKDGKVVLDFVSKYRVTGDPQHRSLVLRSSDGKSST